MYENKFKCPYFYYEYNVDLETDHLARAAWNSTSKRYENKMG
jgi:hypothetical protein